MRGLVGQGARVARLMTVMTVNAMRKRQAMSASGEPAWTPMVPTR